MPVCDLCGFYMPSSEAHGSCERIRPQLIAALSWAKEGWAMAYAMAGNRCGVEAEKVSREALVLTARQLKRIEKP